MWFLGLLLLAAAGGLAWGHRAQQRKLGMIASTEVCTARHLRELAASMADGLGTGSLRFPAAVSGKVRCDQPLTSELAEAPSVYYSMTVSREVESQRREAGGKSSTSRSWEQLAHQKRSVPFTIEDATGRLAVDPEGATFTAETALSRTEPAGGGPRTLTVGRYTLQAPADPRTRGYRFQEETIAVGGEVYVLGEVSDSGGELRLVSPAADGKLLISVKSREQLLKELGSGSKFLRGAAIVSGVLGLLLLIFGL